MPGLWRWDREQLGTLKTQLVDTGTPADPGARPRLPGDGRLRTNRSSWRPGPAAPPSRTATGRSTISCTGTRVDENRGDHDAAFIAAVADRAGVDRAAWDACMAREDVARCAEVGDDDRTRPGASTRRRRIALNGGTPVAGLPDLNALVRRSSGSPARPARRSCRSPARRPDPMMRRAEVRPILGVHPGLILAVLDVIGLAIASYLAVVEVGGGVPVCGPLKGCETVAQSEYSRIGGRAGRRLRRGPLADPADARDRLVADEPVRPAPGALRPVAGRRDLRDLLPVHPDRRHPRGLRLVHELRPEPDPALRRRARSCGSVSPGRRRTRP